MGKAARKSFAVSIHGFGLGPDQSLEHPMGQRGKGLQKTGTLGSIVPR
jgi:hypothetical protein